MVLAGLHREGGGQGDDFGALVGERLEQPGKAEVVADRAAHRDALAIIGDDEIAGLHGRALPVGGAVGRRHVEEVDLAVARDLLALPVEHHGGVVDALFALDRLHERACVDEHAMFGRHLLRHGIGRPARQRLGVARLVALDAPGPVELLGQQNPVGLLLGDGAFDQRPRGGDTREIFKGMPVTIVTGSIGGPALGVKPASKRIHSG